MSSFLSVFNSGLKKTASAIAGKLSSIFLAGKKLEDEDYEALESALIGSDFGVDISKLIISRVKSETEKATAVTEEDILTSARAEVIRIFSENASQRYEPIRNSGLQVVMLVGVNGSGKTTTAGKLAYYYKKRGLKVMLAACDTFRAAAIEQLKIWAEKTGSYVVTGAPGADSASVAFDAITAAKNRGYDLLIIDTAGRQHTKKNLMDELSKIHKITNKLVPDTFKTIIVIDGSMGNNALTQVDEFSKFCKLDAFICSKLDGSYKGGMVVAIKDRFKMQPLFLGLGEGSEDLQPFDPELFASALFSKISS